MREEANGLALTVLTIVRLITTLPIRFGPDRARAGTSASEAEAMVLGVWLGSLKRRDVE